MEFSDQVDQSQAQDLSMLGSDEGDCSGQVKMDINF